jgi:hypothetical protein
MALDKQDGIPQRSTIRIRERRPGQENPLTEANFVARIEEREVNGQPRIHSLEDAEEETQSHQPAVVNN